MRVVLQRVASASVNINDELCAEIGKGLLILVGIEDDDKQEDVDWLASKILHLRIFDDENGIMNLSVKEVDGEILIVSQFTLHASTKKGNRPSYIRAAKPELAVPVYEKFIQKTQELLAKKVQTGRFGAMMEVNLINDGPVTIIIDTKQKEF